MRSGPCTRSGARIAAPRSTSLRRALLVTTAMTLTIAAGRSPASAEPTPTDEPELVAGKNVNMAGGPAVLQLNPFKLEGDPNLERQNEISIDCSNRNPLHCLASANDYRLVDVRLIPHLDESGESAGDAWLGYYTTSDGGARWRSFLHPGHPADPDLAHPLKPYDAAADATVRCTTNGLCLISGIAFVRGKNQPSAVFVTRVMDDNNREASNPFSILGTTVVDKSGNKFLDKTWIEVDRPRAGAKTITIAAHKGVPAQSFAVGNVYLAYSVFVGNDVNVRTKVMFARSTDGGLTFEPTIKLSEGYPINQGTTIAVDDATGAVYVAWRQFQHQSQPHSILIAKSTDFGKTFTKAVAVAAPITPFEQGTTIVSFRTNAFPTMKVLNGNAYVAWAGRAAPDGDGRIVMSVCSAALSCSAPVAIDNPPGRGHQFMPSLAVAGGSLIAAYVDLREDHTIGLYQPTVMPGPDGLVGTDDDEVLYSESREPAPGSDLDAASFQPDRVFTKYVMDAVPDPVTGLPVVSPSLKRRHTLDIRALRINLASLAASGPSVRVSSYPITNRDVSFPGDKRLEQLKFFPSGYPLFVSGKFPFIGDYIDAVGVPSFLPRPDGTWVRNTLSTNATVHIGWGDNRDVRPPADGNWQNFVPVTIPGVTSSAFDPTQSRAACDPAHDAGQTGIRNQNPYTALVTNGLLVGSLGNSKRLGVIDDPFSPDPNLTIPIQRAFTVFVQNATKDRKAYRLTIQPLSGGVSVSFVQLGPAVTTIEMALNPFSTGSRTAFLTAPGNPTASAKVVVEETDGLGGMVVSGGLRGEVILNPDLSNPDLSNPDLSNVPISGINARELYNPDLSNPDLSNPDLSNPDLSNPDLSNPDLSNVSVANPDLSNPDLSNPDLSNPDLSNPDLSNVGVDNPDLSNPDLSNPDLSNAALSDTTWTLTSLANTSAAYTVKLLSTKAVPPGIKTQLLIHKLYVVPTAPGCTERDQTEHVLVANIPNPVFVDPAAPDLSNPDLENGATTNATVSLAPGEQAKITLRVYDPDKLDAITFVPSQVVAPAAVSQAINTQALIDPNIPDQSSVATPLWIATGALADAVIGQPYAQTATAIGGTPPRTWSIIAGSLPPGVTLGPGTGQLTGPATGAPAVYAFTLGVQDSGSPVLTAQRDLSIETVTPLAITTTSLPAVTSGQPFLVGLQSTGGKGTKTWSVVSGSLPAGISLDPATGVLSGLSNAVGLFPFTAQVTDQTSPPQTAVQALTLALAPVLSFTVQPTDVAVDEAIVPAVTVLAQDGTGAVVPGLTLTLAIGTSFGTTNIYGSTSAVTGKTGVAIFPNVRFDTAATIKLKALSLGGSSPESDFLSISPLFKTVLDPSGDAGAGNPDLVEVDAIRNGNAMSFNVIFAAGTFDPATTRATIFLDTDQDIGTGQPGVTAGCSIDGPALGSDYFIEIGGTVFVPARLYKYNYPPCNSFTLLASDLVITPIANGYQVTFPLSLIGNDDGRLNFKAVSSRFLGGGGFTGILDVLPDVGALPGHVDNVLVDAQQPVTDSSSGFTMAIVSGQSLAQVFTVGVTGQLREVRAPLGCSTDLTVEIRNVVAGVPGATVLASQVVPAASIPPPVTSAFRRLTIDSPLAVDAGTQLAVVLSAADSCGVTPGPVANAYPGGDGFAGSTGNWVPMSQAFGGRADMPFQVLVLAPVIP